MGTKGGADRSISIYPFRATTNNIFDASCERVQMGWCNETYTQEEEKEQTY